MAGGGIDVSRYAHSPIHSAIATRDYATLRKILSRLPRLCDLSEIKTEAISLAEEEKADSISSVIDKRDSVPNRETPLHLAVKLCDETSAEMLMVAGADWSLQNEQGWNALQEAICTRQEAIAKTIVRYYQPNAWAKWCRRLPRLVATMRRMRDFYMEITFHFDSSVIPFVSRIAPSDTYKIWKRGANLRADMTLAGFDGFRIQRSDQSILFLGDGSEDGRFPPGSLCVVSHKDKEITNALESAGLRPTEAEVKHEVDSMSKTNIFRPGMNVTQAVLLPQMTWRRQEKYEMVGPWKSKVYDMHNVIVSIKSRRVPGAMSDDEFFSSNNENETDTEELSEILTDEERKQLEAALKMDSCEGASDVGNDGAVEQRHSRYESRDIPIEDGNEFNDLETKNEKKGWFGGWRKREPKNESQKRLAPPRNSISGGERTGGLANGSPTKSPVKPGRHSMDDVRGNKPSSSGTSEGGNRGKDGIQDNEYKKGLRPTIWLSSDFPLRIDELLPLLDILANKVKAIRRLRDLLTTKLPLGTFPVKVAIPVVPTIRVLVTFTKVEELPPQEEFSTPPSSPTASFPESPPGFTQPSTSSSSWVRWIKAPYTHRSKSSSNESSSSKATENISDPFSIPSDYKMVTSEEKRKKMQEKNKAKKAASKNNESSTRMANDQDNTAAG